MPLTLPDIKPKPCVECGMAGVHHEMERTSLFIDSILLFLTRPLNRLLLYATPIIDSASNYFLPPISRFLVKTGIASEINDFSFHPSETAVSLWKEAKLRGIDMKEIRLFGLPRRLYVAKFKNKTWAFEGLPRPTRPQPSLYWIDDKSEVKRRFKAVGFPVAAGELCKRESEAVKIFNKLKHPVIVKPHEGSGGRHVSVHITAEEELVKAFWIAKQVSPFVIVEEEIVGPVFRATLIEKKIAGVLRRDPPCVLGDGKSTIRDLVEKENKNPLRQGPVFAYIDINSPESHRELKWQKINSETILKKGESAFLHFKVNWGVGGTSRDATYEIHPDNKKLFEDIGEYLGDDIVGLDFMISDINISWKQARCGIIECNSLPLIGNHHFPFTGEVRNVAGKVWDMIFPDSVETRIYSARDAISE